MLLKSTISEVIGHQSKAYKQSEKHILRESTEKVSIHNSFVLVVSGVRRCGKSTLVRQLLHKSKEKSIFVNFEDPRLNGFDLDDFVKFDEISKEKRWSILAFDEIQNVPEWEKYVRHKSDEGQRIIITGSNASLLSSELGTRLTGRHLDCEIFPFSFSEFVLFTGNEPGSSSLNHYLNTGGFPEYLKKRDEEILFRLMDDIIYRDIAVRFGIRHHQLLRQLAIYMISNLGKLYSLNNLKKLFGFGSVRSVADYISWFEDSYLIFSLPKFSYSIAKQIVNPRKSYCIDTGLAGANSLSVSKDLGRKLENVIFLNLRRHNKSLFYFAEKKECDFIVTDKGHPKAAIQVCFQLDKENMDRELQGLEEAMTALKIDTGKIITFDQEDSFKIKGNEIKVIPAWKYLMEPVD